MNNEQNGASAGTIDTPELFQLAADWASAIHSAHASTRSQSQARFADLITYIMDWHSAGVAAASERSSEFFLRDMLAIQEACDLHTDEYAPGSVIEYIKELETDLAAAREQTLEEAAKIPREYALKLADGPFGKRWPDEATAICNASTNMADAIRALASQPATAAQTDELSVDRDAPLRGAPAATDGVSSVALEAAAKAIYQLFDLSDVHPWVERGNSLMQDEARRYARVAIKAASEQTSTAGAAKGGMTNQPETSAAAAPVAQAPVAQDGAIYQVWGLAHTGWNDTDEATYNRAQESKRQIVYPVAPVAAPTQVAPVLTDADMDRLHNAIMNLPNHQGPADRERDHWYKIGHRDARHAAAELVSATQAERQPQPADDSMVMIGHVAEIGSLENHHGSPGLVLTRDDRPPVTILMTMEDARSLSKFAFDDVTVTFSAQQQGERSDG